MPIISSRSHVDYADSHKTLPFFAHIKHMPIRYDYKLNNDLCACAHEAILSKTLTTTQCRQFFPHAAMCTDETLITLLKFKWT